MGFKDISENKEIFSVSYSRNELKRENFSGI